MSSTGRLVQWDERKGYGFIRPEGGGEKLFVHASAWPHRRRPPVIGERLSYLRVQHADGRWRADAVRSLEPPDKGRVSVGRGGSGGGSGAGAAVLWLVPAFACLFLGLHLRTPLPHGVWGLYMAMSLAGFIVHAMDKRAARLRQWRVPEWQLLLLAFACGWPGCLLAQQMLRHKSAKASFRWQFALAVALNVLLFVWLATRGG